MIFYLLLYFILLYYISYYIYLLLYFIFIHYTLYTFCTFVYPRIAPKMHEHLQFNNHKIDKTIIKKSIKNTIKHHPNFALVLNPVHPKARSVAIKASRSTNKWELNKTK